MESKLGTGKSQVQEEEGTSPPLKLVAVAVELIFKNVGSVTHAIPYLLSFYMEPIVPFS